MSEEKTGRKDVVFMITVVSIVIIVVFLIVQLQKSNNKPQGIGTGENDFWNRTTNHPSWVVSDVQSKPLLILSHSQYCTPCITMTEICESLNSIYSEELTYYDILSGVDEPEATETFNAYDPNDQEHYIPLTIVITKGPNNQIIWHSWEGVVDEQTLTSWLDDAISYHQENMQL